VLVDNPAALHLYESCGFTVLGTEDYYLIPL
jgi:ribosomal protein S18 acetylase RimI-like enzyme